jgi:hypothetical protein
VHNLRFADFDNESSTPLKFAEEFDSSFKTNLEKRDINSILNPEGFP